MDAWLAGLLSLLGVVVGVGLQFFLSRQAQERHRLIEARNLAYADVLSGAALVASGDARTGFAKFADAKARVMVYGSSEVIEKRALFSHNADLGSETRQGTFLDLVEQMRRENGEKFAPKFKEAVATNLFGPQIDKKR